MPDGIIDWTSESEEDPDRVPAGLYVFDVVKCMVKQKDGRESFSYCLEVAGGDHKGKAVWVNFCVQNPTKPKGQAMARKEFKTFATCCGRPDVGHAKDLESWSVKAKLYWDGDWPRFQWHMPVEDTTEAPKGAEIPF